MTLFQEEVDLSCCVLVDLIRQQSSREKQAFILLDLLTKRQVLSAEDQERLFAQLLSSPNAPNGAFQTEPNQKIDFGIITIKTEEFTAMLKRFEVVRFNNRNGRLYSISHIQVASGQSYSVAIVCCGEQGVGKAQEVADRLIEDFDPSYIFLVGIAGGVPSIDYTLGDVIVATYVYDYTREAIDQNNEQTFSLGGGPVHKRVQNLLHQLPAMDNILAGWNTEESITMSQPPINSRKMTGDPKWKARIKNSLQANFGDPSIARTPKVKAGRIASSDRLVKQPELIQKLLPNARDILAVEMEAAGVYRATDREDKKYMVINIRALSDIIGLERDDNWTIYACHCAAAFAHALIRANIMELMPPVDKDNGVV